MLYSIRFFHPSSHLGSQDLAMLVNLSTVNSADWIRNKERPADNIN